MNRFLFFTILLALFSCGKQSQKPKNDTEQQPIEKQEDPIVTVVLKKNDSISIDPELVRKLSKKEISSIFTNRTKRQLDIIDPIYQGYSYKDKDPVAEHYLVLTDHRLKTEKTDDTLYDEIRVFNLSYKKNKFKKRATIKDIIDKEWETSISFWNRYSEIADMDNDGLTDLILVYGTMGQDLYADGRVRIVTYHGKRRITIKHQNSDFGDGRVTKINSLFYLLPKSIQQKVKEKMKLMAKNGNAVFSKGWEKQMKKEAIRIEGE